MLNAFDLSAWLLGNCVKHAARSCTHGSSTCYSSLYFIAKCIVLILIYTGKNIIVQLQNPKVSATKVMLAIVRQHGWSADGWEEEEDLLC